MGILRLNVEDKIVLRWDQKTDLPQDLLVRAESLIHITGDASVDDGAVALGLNRVNVEDLVWCYGFAERVDDWFDELSPLEGETLGILFDCVGLGDFEGAVRRYAGFYPEGIDERDVPSIDYVYRKSLEDGPNTPIDLANLAEENVDRHIDTVQTVLKQLPRGIVQLTTPAVGWQGAFNDRRWYVLGLAQHGKTGMPVTMYDYPEAFLGTNGLKASLVSILEPDAQTQRRLRRIFSLDFVSDVNLEPPIVPETEPAPVLVLYPSETQLKEREWERLIADHGPLVWDEKLVIATVSKPEGTSSLPATTDSSLPGRSDKMEEPTTPVKQKVGGKSERPRTPKKLVSKASVKMKQPSPQKRVPLAPLKPSVNSNVNSNVGRNLQPSPNAKASGNRPRIEGKENLVTRFRF